MSIINQKRFTIIAAGVAAIALSGMVYYRLIYIPRANKKKHPRLVQEEAELKKREKESAAIYSHIEETKDDATVASNSIAFANSADSMGCPISTRSTEMIEIFDRYVKCVLEYGQDWPVAIEGPKRDPQCLMAYVIAMDFYIAAEIRHLSLQALHVAKLLISGEFDADDSLPTGYTTDKTPRRNYIDREVLYVQAMELWLQGELCASSKIFYDIAALYPHDLFAVKRCQLTAFLNGDTALMLKVVQLEEVVRWNVGQPFYHGMLAFALEQNGNLIDSEREGRIGSKICATDAWSHHAVAHSLLFQCKLMDGIRWMTNLSDRWDKCCSFMKSHNLWHLGLFYLEADDFKTTLELFKSKIWAVDPSNIQDQLGALGLLLKVELRMAPTEIEAFQMDSLWLDVVTRCLASPHAHNHNELLYDTLLCFGINRIGKVAECDSFIEEVKSFISDTCTPSRKAHLELVWVGAMEGLRSFSRGQYEEAAFTLWHCLGRLGVLGGSSEQLDVINEVAYESLLRSSRFGVVCPILEERNVVRPSIPATMRMLSRAYLGLGRNEDAKRLDGDLAAVKDCYARSLKDVLASAE